MAALREGTKHHKASPRAALREATSHTNKSAALLELTRQTKTSAALLDSSIFIRAIKIIGAAPKIIV